VPAEARGPARRTQAERRATTRAALLDAALDCLVEEGYAALTTRNVAERAGVSQGTQMHHFPTRARFVAEAVRHVAFKLADELPTAVGAGARSKRRRLESLLDHVWGFHLSPVFQATLELWVAARTDGEIRAAMHDVVRDVGVLIGEAAGELFPELMAKPRAREALDVTLATIRGLAMLQSVLDADEVEHRWRRARGQLLLLYDNL
jgi:AcrR family transcriptional regulator